MEFERYSRGCCNIHNKYGIGFGVVFAETNRESGDNHKYLAFLHAAKRIEMKDFCMCNEDGELCELDDEGICRMAYQEIHDTVNSDNFDNCLAKVIDKVNDYIRCYDCAKLHIKYKRSKICPECNLQKLIDKRSKSLGECVCCTDKMYSRNTNKLKCGHSFHKKCLSKVKNGKCPLCRKEIETS